MTSLPNSGLAAQELLGGRKRTGKTSGRRTKYPDNKAALIFLAPWIIGMIALVIGPLIASLGLSFTDYNLLQNADFVGLKNYNTMIADARLHKSLLVTFTYVLVGVPLQLIVALFLALILNRGLRGLAFYRSAFYLPSLLGSSVAIAILWRNVFGGDGIFNKLLALVGVHTDVSWVANTDTALWTIILLHVWTFGSPMIIFLAALRQIPVNLYEAAACDGAGTWAQFRYVTIPALTPIIFFNLVLTIIQSFQAFTQAFVVSGGSGGPSDSTLFYTLYLYQQAFGKFHMGYASAMAWLLVVIIAVFTALNFFLSKYWVHYDD